MHCNISIVTDTLEQPYARLKTDTEPDEVCIIYVTVYK